MKLITEHPSLKPNQFAITSPFSGKRRFGKPVPDDTIRAMDEAAKREAASGYVIKCVRKAQNSGGVLRVYELSESEAT